MHIDTEKLWLSVAGFLLGCAALALLTWVTFALDLKPLAAGLFYVAIVVVLSMLGEIVPAIALAVIGVLCLDYFFLEPRFSLLIDTPEDGIAAFAFCLTRETCANRV